MAGHGANVIHLKRLQHHKVVPQLYEHVSIMRPGVEDAIVERAVALGQRLGVQVSAELYLAAGARDENDYRRKADDLKDAAAKHLDPAGPGFGENPIADFKAIAGGVTMVRERGDRGGPRAVVSPGAGRDEVRRVLDVRTPPSLEGGAPFHCMEPFKTLYVTRNGEAKPCCFANPTATYLGSVQTNDAAEVWRGEGFETVREAITVGDYPMRSCETCLRNHSGPRDHFAGLVIARYLDWQANKYALPLRKALAARAPTALKAIQDSQPSQIMARRRGRLTRSPTTDNR
jgi:hypothetical protein